jgi:hypothetical protein
VLATNIHQLRGFSIPGGRNRKTFVMAVLKADTDLDTDSVLHGDIKRLPALFRIPVEDRWYDQSIFFVGRHFSRSPPIGQSD